MRILDDELAKFRDDIFINNAIYGLQREQVNSTHRVIPPRGIKVEEYILRKAWIEFFYEFIWIGCSHTVKGILYSAPMGSSELYPKVEFSHINSWDYRPVFISIVQVSKQREQFQFNPRSFDAIPSLVRLKAIHKPLYSSWSIREGSSISGGIRGFYIKNGKLAFGVINGVPTDGVNLKSKKIQRTPQIMNKVTDDKPPFLRNISNMDEIVKIFPVIFLDDTTRVALKETPDLLIKQIQVRFCSPRLV